MGKTERREKEIYILLWGVVGRTVTSLGVTVLNMVATQPVLFKKKEIHRGWESITLTSPSKARSHLPNSSKGDSPTNVTSRIPRACSSALVPVGVEVNVPIFVRGREKQTIFFHKTERLIMRLDEEKIKEPMRTMTYFYNSDANIRSNWRVKRHLWVAVNILFLST